MKILDFSEYISDYILLKGKYAIHFNSFLSLDNPKDFQIFEKVLKIFENNKIKISVYICKPFIMFFDNYDDSKKFYDLFIEEDIYRKNFVLELYDDRGNLIDFS